VGPREVITQDSQAGGIAEENETKIIDESQAKTVRGGREGVPQTAETENDTAENPVNRITPPKERTIVEKRHSQTQLQQVNH
jgi:hypothetical protein